MKLRRKQTPSKLTGQAKTLDRLHLKYEKLLISEIESLIGIASVHGWKSYLYSDGLRARQALRRAGSEIPEEQS